MKKRRGKKFNYRKEFKDLKYSVECQKQYWLERDDRQAEEIKDLKSRLARNHNSAVGQMLQSMGEGMHAMSDALRTVNKQW